MKKVLFIVLINIFVISTFSFSVNLGNYYNSTKFLRLHPKHLFAQSDTFVSNGHTFDTEEDSPDPISVFKLAQHDIANEYSDFISRRPELEASDLGMEATDFEMLKTKAQAVPFPYRGQIERSPNYSAETLGVSQDRYNAAHLDMLARKKLANSVPPHYDIFFITNAPHTDPVIPIIAEARNKLVRIPTHSIPTDVPKIKPDLDPNIRYPEFSSAMARILKF